MKKAIPQLFLTTVSLIFVTAAHSQDLGFQRARFNGILQSIRSDIQDHYFDAKFKGIDVEKNYKAASESIKNAESIGQMNAIIAQFLIQFNDSHLFYVPPGKVNKVNYGFQMRSIGQKCYVVWVDPKSDAGKLGLSPGDELYSIEGYAPTREGLWLINYALRSITPRPTLKLGVIRPDGRVLAMEVAARITQGRQLTGQFDSEWEELDVKEEDEYVRSRRQGYLDKVDGLFIWKIPSFSVAPMDVDSMFDKIKKKDRSLIIDLRGNGGGRLDMLLRMIGNIFDKDVVVADEKKRKETKPVIAKTRGKDSFKGKIVVLIDSASASASEVFSKVVQLENRGTVFGDRSAGAVMESQFYSHTSGADIVVFFGASITVADLIMKDGKSLEQVGVQPDQFLLPSAADLAAKRDPVLAKAAASLGFEIPAEAAGRIFADFDNPEK